MAKSAATHLMDENGVGGKIMSWPQRTKSFYSDVRTEMKKVSSPSWREVRATTLVVIITVALFAAYFWAVDYALGSGVNALLHRFGK